MMDKITDFISRFGFNATPFTCEIPVRDHFKLPFFQENLDHLEGVVKKRMSAALIAPAGTGKTSLLRSLLNRLSGTRYRCSYIKVTDLAKRDFCREIAVAVGADSVGTYPALVRRLQDRFVNTLDMNGIRTVIILDEAHDIRPDVLGVIRILTNFNMDNRLVISVIMAGQPSLTKLLNMSKLEDTSHRLAHRANLRLLSRAELSKYLQHRCQINGCTTCPFDQEAIEAVYEISRGNMRAADYLALKSLEIAHNQDCGVVDSNHIITARRHLWG